MANLIRIAWFSMLSQIFPNVAYSFTKIALWLREAVLCFRKCCVYFRKYPLKLLNIRILLLRMLSIIAWQISHKSKKSLLSYLLAFLWFLYFWNYFLANAVFIVLWDSFTLWNYYETIKTRCCLFACISCFDSSFTLWNYYF